MRELKRTAAISQSTRFFVLFIFITVTGVQGFILLPVTLLEATETVNGMRPVFKGGIILLGWAGKVTRKKNPRKRDKSTVPRAPRINQTLHEMSNNKKAKRELPTRFRSESNVALRQYP